MQEFISLQMRNCLTRRPDMADTRANRPRAETAVSNKNMQTARDAVNGDRAVHDMTDMAIQKIIKKSI